MNEEKSITINLDEGRTITVSTGKLANLANGSCLLTMGETTLLVAACSGSAAEGADFLPLQVDYREKYSAAGKFPGGYIKREGRPTEKEILTCRMTDRPIRPLFPKGFFDEIQVQALLLSADGENDSDVLCMLGASVALCLSDLPFNGPIGALRVGCVDGKFVANPTHSEMKKSTLDLVYAGLPDKVIMIEGESSFCSEETLRDAMKFANEIVKKQVEAQRQLAAKAGRAKKEPTLHLASPELEKAIYDYSKDTIESACLIPAKAEREKALDVILEGAQKSIPKTLGVEPDSIKNLISLGFDQLVQKTIRHAIVAKGFRPDGRGIEDLRKISCEVGVLPRVHGTGLFTRGETQGLVITTLGSRDDAQEHDQITGGETTKKFYLHYNFPNFSVGEVGRISGPGRREIGHGNLAERSLAMVIPSDYPYTVRCISEIMASNGSTSMASVCGGSLSLMDAGVPIKAAVAGISCGLVCEDGKELLLTDIIGAEDHFGDMDFKVCGTRDGITGFQLDLKIAGISIDLLYEAMLRNKTARSKILDLMDGCIKTHRPDISKYAPRITTIKINPEKIGAVIGPGGKMIRGICESTGAKIDIDDDGSVNVFAADADSMQRALDQINALAAEVEIGKIYRGTVKSIKEFGAFVEFLPGQEGLVHISELADYRVAQVSDICKEGGAVTVKVIDIDERGRVRLSRKAALAEMDK